ncbi:hypothetical protein, partial [Acrocarpospora corrugata]|uniref:hypothetical protein n=1 Tax=Acrocarpospora corrugata TaxID=35763 RepID=UPI0031D27318
MNFLKVREPKQQSTPDLDKPEKLPTRWVIIAAIAIALGLLVGSELPLIAWRPEPGRRLGRGK